MTLAQIQVSDISESDRARFWSKVDKYSPTGCWEWTAGKTDGYGQFHVRRPDGTRANVRAHRIAWLLDHGELIGGEVLDHVCRNRGCVNTEHLRQISSGENVLCGIGPTAVNLRKLRCLRGHPYSEDNTRYRSNGHRECIECDRARSRKHHAVIKECPRCGKGIRAGGFARHIREVHRDGFIK